MNEFNAVSAEELTQVEGGSWGDFFAGVATGVAVLAAPGAAVFAAGVAIGYTATSAAMK